MSVLLPTPIESGTAGVPCGYQDQLAAAFGGVNLTGHGLHAPMAIHIIKEIPVKK